MEFGDRGLEKVDGVEAKNAVVEQLGAALEVIRRYGPARIVTLGGECSGAWLRSRNSPPARAMTWPYCGSTPIPDVGTPASTYPGYHAMAVAVLTGDCAGPGRRAQRAARR